ncbi:hypothetical protein B0T21DRAFT_159826 [Apiosordaria backusii]|uniref:Uncharacterized protein n=1 Tax=Apiosordaria backusii TaxID=314023 RepID=A0AA40EG50_9PEZI|nr:hypothetical protein B0T21DRAFT_159826 [Apiosordaria backusii]
MGGYAVRDIGFTILHQPKNNTTPDADVILVHGLQGHPRRTWLHSPIQGQAPLSSSASDEGQDIPSPSSRRNSVGISGLARAMTWRSHHTTPSSSGANKQRDDDGIYWPKDLLPKDCPNTRIMVWGYDTAVTRGFSAVDKSDLFSHARDLLYSIDRQRPKGQKVVFVAHSLGGLLVKEMLRRAEESGEHTSIRDILTSTVAVIFLGTPHRGSADFAKLGDIVRRVAGTVLRVDTNSNIIRALGIDSPVLELSRESFLRQWQTYGFQVKTFQEGRAMTGINIGRLKDKVVPDSSSSLDDARECAETIHADHRSMTKYWGAEDPNYGKVGGEISRIIARLSQKPPDSSPLPILSVEAQNYLQSLAFESMFDRQDNINSGLANTCRWLQEARVFTTWSSRQNVSTDHGLLWLKGKPGAGKSTLMKSAVAATTQSEEGRSNIATFYFNARGDHLEKTPLGLLRSILYQLCRQDVHVLDEFLKICKDKRTRGGAQALSWTAAELEAFIRRLFSQQKPRRTFIFVDALDECVNLDGSQDGEHTVRQVVYLLFEIAQSAFDSGISLNICLSSRHYPTISLPDCPEIVVEEGNASDIAVYVRDMFRMVPPSEVAEIARIQSLLIEKASGVFLWVVLVIEILLRDIHNGQPMSRILERLKAVPKRMEDLYAQLFGSLTAEERLFSVSLIQWVLLRKGRMADELHAICLAARLSSINRAPTANDFAGWGYTGSPIWQPNDRMLRLVKSASRGLIEYTFGTVKFIHETVREFFLHGPGFKILDARLCQNPCGLGYASLVTGCLNIMDLPEQHGPLASFREYAVENLLKYAREVEVHHASNIELLRRLQLPGSRSWFRHRVHATLYEQIQPHICRTRVVKARF